MSTLQSLSLYIHVPFCAGKCRYCDFYSRSGVGADVMNHMMSTVLKSLDRQLARLRPETIPTVFIGGGTPSLLAPELLEGFLVNLRERIGTPREFTIEANPESVDENFLDVLNSSDVNRISMGVQTYEQHLLEWLGRPAGEEAIRRADSLLGMKWKGRLSRDLMAALPGSPKRLAADIGKALADNPGHLSVYELTVEEGTELARSSEDLKDLPDEDVAADEWSATVSDLKARGYQRYEISNFATNGSESLHNMRYWRMEPYLGIGPSAVSTLPADATAGGSRAAAVRRETIPDLEGWLADPDGLVLESGLTVTELAVEHLMMGLRTAEGISRSRFNAIFGQDPAELAPGAFELFTAAGRLTIDESAIRPTSAGMDILDGILIRIVGEFEVFFSSENCSWPLFDLS